MKWFKDFLNDPQAIRDTISGIIIGVPFIVLLFYWGVLDKLTIDNLNLEVSTISFIAIVFLVAGDMAKVDWRRRSKEDSEQKDEISSLIIENDEILFTEQDDEQGYKLVDELNEQTQHRMNIELTKNPINKLRNKRAKLLRKNAPIEELKKLQSKIDKLVKTPLEPRWFNPKYKITPFVYFDIISPYDEMDSTVKIKDGNSTKSNPINRGRVRSWIIGFFRSVLLASAGLGIGFTVPLGTALVVLLMLAFTLLAVSVMAYHFNNKYMLGKHKQTLNEKIQRKKKLRKDIDDSKGTDLMFKTIYDTVGLLPKDVDRNAVPFIVGDEVHANNVDKYGIVIKLGEQFGDKNFIPYVFLVKFSETDTGWIDGGDLNLVGVEDKKS